MAPKRFFTVILILVAFGVYLGVFRRTKSPSVKESQELNVIASEKQISHPRGPKEKIRIPEGLRSETLRNRQSNMPVAALTTMTGELGRRIGADVGETCDKAMNRESETDHDPGLIFSELNQAMDDLLSGPEIPSDYGSVMVEWYRDTSRGVIVRDFAVQHIGLYAQALNRNRMFSTDSFDAENCRRALFDAARETDSIIAAAAFRALSDISEFDNCVDSKSLDAMLVSCIGEKKACDAARVMAVQLCGERRIASSKSAIEVLLADEVTPFALKAAANWTRTQLKRR